LTKGGRNALKPGKDIQGKEKGTGPEKRMSKTDD